MARRVAIAAGLLLLAVPAVARANGDPASDYLLVQDLFLPAFSLYNKAQRYAEFLGLELSFQYRDRLLVVMPNGYGYSIGGRPNAAGEQVVKRLPPPGKDATKEVEGATVAIRKLAAASGLQLPAPAGGGGSKTRDRITVAAGALALAALLAAIVFWRRERTPKEPTAGV